MTDKLTCFKAYDIRGKLGLELNEDIAYHILRLPIISNLAIISCHRPLLYDLKIHHKYVGQ
jgi:hypothetical protein